MKKHFIFLLIILINCSCSVEKSHVKKRVFSKRLYRQGVHFHGFKAKQKIKSEPNKKLSSSTPTEYSKGVEVWPPIKLNSSKEKLDHSFLKKDNKKKEGKEVLAFSETTVENVGVGLAKAKSRNRKSKKSRTERLDDEDTEKKNGLKSIFFTLLSTGLVFFALLGPYSSGVLLTWFLFNAAVSLVFAIIYLAKYIKSRNQSTYEKNAVLKERSPEKASLLAKDYEKKYKRNRRIFFVILGIILLTTLALAILGGEYWFIGLALGLILNFPTFICGLVTILHWNKNKKAAKALK